MGSVVTSRNSYTIASADPLIGKHAIHWVLCNESYNGIKRMEIDGWQFVGETEDSVMYHFPGDAEIAGQAIVAFRGTSNLGDIKNDIQLSIAGNNGCNFEKLKPATDMVQAFMADNPDVPLQLTGHSLGGAVARCAGQKLGLGIVTFNAAAPPSNPVQTGPNEVDYHIVFDLISAWENPNTVRIDKGYRPSNKTTLNPINYIVRKIYPLLKAHELSNFSNERRSVVIKVQDENNLIMNWYNSLSFVARYAVDKFTRTIRLLPLPGSH